jgi:hypothetical protein
MLRLSLVGSEPSSSLLKCANDRTKSDFLNQKIEQDTDESIRCFVNAAITAITDIYDDNP